VILLALVACGPADPCAGELADACRYAEVSAGPLATPALERACGAIGDAHTRDMCWLAGVMQREGDTSDDTRALCDRLADPVWRDECAFIVLDRRVESLDPAAWVAACRREAARFFPHCARHGVFAWAAGARGEGAAWFTPGALGEQFAAIEAALGGPADPELLAPELDGLRGILAARAGRRAAITAHARGHWALGPLARAAAITWRDAEAPRWW